ncbi:hypothetical protein Sjap_007342 [Stephania japonica]|uniref:Uncharacterized protein n=1 Tax=Stephania japonica TaxID=461633 RepID=A0AAP0P9X7_9MAGN
MVDFRSGFYPPEKRRLEIVSGKEFSANQTYTMMVNNQHRSSPDHDQLDYHQQQRQQRVAAFTTSHRRSKRRSGLAGSSSWRLSDPEMKRRRSDQVQAVCRGRES